MEKVILIKYGELTTKKGNRNFFVKTLTKNIESKLQTYHIEIEKDLSRMYIHYDPSDETEILNDLQEVFGIHSYHLAYVTTTNLQALEECLISTIKKEQFKTFKVEVKRSDKSFPKTSSELAPIFGSIVLKNKENIKVDVNNPEVTIIMP